MQPWFARGERPLLIGVVHLAPTPGAPGFAGSVESLLERARADARALVEGGADALLVENYGDAPFFQHAVPPEAVAALALALRVAREVAGELPVGVNVLRNDARSALGLCAATGAAFVRVNVHSGAMVTDQGLIEGRAAETLRERARLCPAVALFADVHVKHATPLGRESLADAAEDTYRRGRADVLIVTGARTGDAPLRALIDLVRERVPEAPLLVGSGVDERNARELLGQGRARGAIVGTSLKRGGRIEGPVEVERVARLRALFDECR